ncbi:uncharacterized protein [Dermacentor albipictus]|uniref:uncharacterized protein isoform X2 n=1 Tax=Dermacentor albipictus TaxID=60249 RepID=UPI0038FCA223
MSTTQASDAKETGEDSWCIRRTAATAALLASVGIGYLVGCLIFYVAYFTARHSTSPAAPMAHTTSLAQSQAWFRDQPNDKVCYTAACAKTAKELRDSINPVVPPCEHFQDYVCGRRSFQYGSARAELNLEVLMELITKWAALVKAVPRHPIGAPEKAAYLLLFCTWSFVRSSNASREELIEFARNEGLNLTGPPANVATGPADVLALHVHLSFDYMLGGLVRIVPSTPGCLSVEVDSWLAERDGVYKALTSQESSALLKMTASLGGVTDTDDIIRRYSTLLTYIKAAASGTIPMGPSVIHTNADLVVLEGIGEKAFADAVAAKTPYPRSAAVDMNSHVPFMLEAVWQRVGSDELYLWTSWTVLEQLLPYVYPAVAKLYGKDEFVNGCIKRIRQPFGAPFAAIALLPTQTLRNDVRRIVRAIVECLARNTHRWFPSAASIEGTNVVIGFPPEEDTLEKLNVRYAPYLDKARGEFLPDWLQAMKIRRQRLNISHVHFDPTELDIVVSRDGLVVVPAGAVFALYRDGDLPAINMGSLGQWIGRSFLQRFQRPSVKPKPQCRAPVDSKAENVFESLLAYQCTRKIFSGSVVPNTRTALPMHQNLTPARQLFVAACFKSSHDRTRSLLQ